jgi:Arc/MetJ-type ribon-helix-helix transcriptional regulator
MVRTQIQLTESQAERLRKLASERGVSMAELIRQGVDTLLGGGAVISEEERRKRALALAGRFRSGKKDGSRKHDKYLADAFRT